MKANEPSEPVLFLKPPSSMIGDGETIVIPEGIGRVDHEVELALMIAKGGRRIEVSRSLEHVGWVAVFNDVTARDMQSEAKRSGMPWTLSKGIDTFSPISFPVPIGEVPDIHDLGIELSVNGARRQSGNTSEMIFAPEEIIAYISRWMTLEEGDIIATGTPEGVGPMVPGDTVEARIEGVGKTTNPVRSA